MDDRVCIRLLDLYSRRVVGWAMGERPNLPLALNALDMTLLQRLPQDGPALVHHCYFVTQEQPRSAVFNYIEIFYYRQRRYQTLGYVSPTQFERMNGVSRLNRPHNPEQLRLEYLAPSLSWRWRYSSLAVLTPRASGRRTAGLAAPR